MTTGASRRVIETTVREESAHVIAALMAFVHDLDLAEDLYQDSLVAALEHWGQRGVPDQPRAWLLATARRRAIDGFRRYKVLESKRPELEAAERQRELEQADLESQHLALEPIERDAAVPDERLRLMFTCCHPALPADARVALTLKTLGGLSTGETARAFLVPEPTMAQRLVRAKRKIRVAGIPYRVPNEDEWPERTESVLSSIYLIFNEGYAASSGEEPVRPDLCREAIRLGRILAELAPEEPEALGLLALMLLHDSRRQARVDDDGSMVPLDSQDRTRWNHDSIEEGVLLLRRAVLMAQPGPYRLQAEISAAHARAASFATTDWERIWQLYSHLATLQPSPVVELNALVALSFARGPHVVLDAVEQMHVDRVLDEYQPFHAARADVLRRVGREAEAMVAYRRAIELAGNAAEARFLAGRLEEIARGSTPARR